MEDLAAAIEALIAESGGLGYALAYAYTIAVAIIPFPAEFPAMLNGMLFGPLVGTLISWSAGLIGAHVSFELSRRCGRPLVARFVRAETLDRADRLVLASGALGLLLLRLTPVVAFTAINWAAGLTTLRRWTFLWTTAVGILPGAILFTVSGSGVAALSRRHPALGVALLAFLIGLAVLIHARIRRSSRSAAAAAEPPSGEL